jgi:chitodextrinase
MTFSTVTSSDTTPPTVSLSAPANGATVSGTVTVSANASDNVGVASVQFQLDGANLGSLDTTAPYSISWNTANATNGSHSLRAIAKDAAGNSTTSASVSVSVSNVADTQAPSVPGGLVATAVSSSQIGLAWTPSTDNVGVSGYRVYRGGAQIGTATGTSFQDGGLNASTQYSYTVAAFDAAGNLSAQSAAASATTLVSGGGGLPSALGWFQIPNSAYQTICPSASLFPSIQGSEGCAGVVNDWSGGFADTTRNRLVWWGGGHAGYYGNEIYYLDLQTLTIGRYTDPVTGLSGSSQCGAANPLDDLNWNGTPNSFHNYQGQVYVPTIDAMFFTMGDMSRGTNSCTATALNDGLGRGWPTWIFKFGELPSTLPAANTTAWHPQDSQFGGPLTFGGGGKGWARDATPLGEYASTGWDPVSKQVYVYDQYSIYTWDPTTNVGTLVAKSGALNTSSTSAVVSSIDPVHRIFLIYGNHIAVKFDMTAKTATDVSSQTSGCSATQGAIAPAIDYDTTQNVFVTWAGGNTVYLFNASSSAISTQYGSVAPLACLPVTYSGGPAAQGVNGTYGRFRYFPALGVFAVVNAYNQNAYALRLTSGSGTGSAAPVISAVAANSITTNSATIAWTTDVATTSQVEYGTTTSYGTLTTLNSTLVTAHSVALTGLTANTAYHYRARSKNSAGTETIGSDAVFSTSTSGDTTPPTVSISAPANGAALTGSVTVSANASDNVGVVGVQFMVDSSNLGAEVTASPYTITWDTSTATNGTHTLTARARDAAGNSTVSAAVSVTTNNAVAANTFQQRCAAAGVIKCVGFDALTDITPFISADGNGVIQASLDTTISASGGGSLKFVIPATSGQNSSGSWSDRLGGSFGPGTTFFVQYRQRFSPEFVNTNYNGNGWKQSIFHMAGSTCASIELTTQNTWQHGFPEMYTDCGARGFEVPLNGGTDTLLEQGDTSTTGYNCHYINQVAPFCAFYQPNTWMTFYYEVVLGSWGTPTSTIKAWVAYEGGPMQEFINMQGYTLNFNNSASDVYNSITLLPYNTNKPASQVNPVAYTWYDELIVSTQPIPAPTGPTPAP